MYFYVNYEHIIGIYKHFIAPQGGLSVDSISDLVESQSRLLEALQLSHPAELELIKSPGGSSSEGRTQTKLSLNPIYRQVPRVLERCCSHIETYGEDSSPPNFHPFSVIYWSPSICKFLKDDVW